MSVVGTDPASGVCVNHPRRETGLRCGKCGDFICTKCMIATPVGVRCKPCAQLRRLPQFDVNLWLLARSGFAGLLTSFAAWFIVEYILFIRFFLSIFVGMAVAEVMSRLAKRRTSRLLEAIAIFDVLAGLMAVEAVHVRDYFHLYLTELANQPNLLVSLAIPAAIASFVAVVKLRP